MYSFAIADGWASDGLWAWTQASIELDEAIAAMDAAAVALGDLVTSTAWEAGAVRVLNEKLVDVRSRAGAVSGVLAAGAAELREAGAWAA